MATVFRALRGSLAAANPVAKIGGPPSKAGGVKDFRTLGSRYVGVPVLLAIMNFSVKDSCFDESTFKCTNRYLYIIYLA